METLKSTYEKANEISNPNSVKGIVHFAGLDSELAQTILEFVRDCSSTFCSDICKKAIEKSFELSEKQAWCVSYEFIKIKHQFSVWTEKQMIELEWPAEDMNLVLTNLK